MRKNKIIILQALIFLLLSFSFLVLPLSEQIELSKQLFPILFIIIIFCILFKHRKNKIFKQNKKQEKKQNFQKENYKQAFKNRKRSFYDNFIFENKQQAFHSYKEYIYEKMNEQAYNLQNNYYNSLEINEALNFMGINKHFDLLTSQDIKIAYRKKAKELHPDLNNNSNESKIKMQKLNEYYELLISHKERK